MNEPLPQSRGRVVIATHNEGKRIELRALLGDQFDVLSMVDLDLPSPPETGSTFAENAALKAKLAAEASGIVAIGDDSGLEVAALDGEPGVRSARFAGEPPNDANNRALLLQCLAEVPRLQRRARFVCSLAIATPTGEIEIVEGNLEGMITDKERGTNGFGYDSLFELDNGSTLAELTIEEKSRVSHRGRALRRALPVLRRLASIGRP